MKAIIINNGDISIALLEDLNFYVLALSTILTASAGYIINDYYDVKIDLINKPQKTLVGRYISRRKALFLHLSLSIAGIILGLYNGWLIGLLHFLSTLLLWFYSNTLKRLPLTGNICIALLSGLSIYLVAILYRSQYMEIAVYALFAFYISLIREVIKDIQDLKGDQKFGCKTLPIIWGIRKTKRLILLIIFLFICNMVFFFPFFSIMMIGYLSILVIIPLVALGFYLNKSDTHKEFKSLSSFCKIIMLSGMVSILFLS